MAQTVGVIEYVVRADIEHLLTGNKRINATLDEMEARFNKADATVNKVSGSLYSANLKLDDAGIFDPTKRQEYVNSVLAHFDAHTKLNKSLKDMKTSPAQTKLNELKKQLDVLNSGFDQGSRKMFVYQALQGACVDCTSKLGEKISKLAGDIFDATQKQKDLNDAIAQDPKKAASKVRDDCLAQIKRQIDSEAITFEEGERKKLEIAAQYTKAIADARSKTAVTATLATGATVASGLAAAYAPAAEVSQASFAGNAAPAQAGLLSTHAMSETLSIVNANLKSLFFDHLKCPVFDRLWPLFSQRVFAPPYLI